MLGQKKGDPMTLPHVVVIRIDQHIESVGKIFYGDYANSPQWISEVHKELSLASISSLPNKVMGIYYDNPQEKNADQLRSFQGVFISDETARIPETLCRVSLTGDYLYVRVSGDPMKSLLEGYRMLFAHIRANSTDLESTAGYQISTFDSGIVNTEIYMKLREG